MLQSAAAAKPSALGSSDVSQQRELVGHKASEFFQGVAAIEALLYAIPVGLAVLEILTTITPIKAASTLMAKWIVRAILVTALATAISALFEAFVKDPLALLPVPFPNYGDFIFTAEDFALTFAMHRFLRPQYTWLFEFGQYGPKVFGTIAGLKNILLSLIVASVASAIPAIASGLGLSAGGLVASFAMLALDVTSFLLVVNGLNLIRVNPVAEQFLALTTAVAEGLGIVGVGSSLASLVVDVSNINTARGPPPRY